MSRTRVLFVVALSVLLLSLAFAFGRATLATPAQQGSDLTGSQASPPNPSTPSLSSQGEMASADAASAPAATLPYTPTFWYKYYNGSDFISRSPTQYETVYAAPGGIYSSAGTLSQFITRVDLPQGARIREIIFIFVDNSTEDIGYWLVRYDPLNNAYSDLISNATSGAATSIRTQTTTGAPITTIDNCNYAYQLNVRTYVANSTQTIKGFRVGFEIPLNYLPLIMGR